MKAKALGLILACAAPGLMATPAVPEQSAPAPFSDAPAPWREYLLGARAAVNNPDPMERCLAVPDLPGNKWPAGHAQAHCKYHATKVLSLSDIDQYLRRQDLKFLDQHLDGLLGKHFSDTDFGEDIHLVFDQFDSRSHPDADAISARWVAIAPRNSYALLARATFLSNESWRARGREWASKTPRENMRRMSEFAEQAIAMFQEAVRLRPRLMPAYVGLVEMGTINSQEDIVLRAVADASDQDLGCMDLARAHMQATLPRWGGSYEEMLDVSAELARVAGKRPLLALHIGAPYADRAQLLRVDGEYPVSALEALDIAVQTGSNDDNLALAANAEFNRVDGNVGAVNWKAVGLALQAERFAELNAYTHTHLAKALYRDAPEWGLRHASRAVELEPDNAPAHHFMALALAELKNFEAAEREYLLAALNPMDRDRALENLASMWVSAESLPAETRVQKASPVVARLTREYPTRGGGWLLHIQLRSLAGEGADRDAIENFVKYADPDDPWQAENLPTMKAALERLP